MTVLGGAARARISRLKRLLEMRPVRFGETESIDVRFVRSSSIRRRWKAGLVSESALHRGGGRFRLLVVVDVLSESVKGEATKWLREWVARGQMMASTRLWSLVEDSE